ncbi:peptidase, partial [Gardnerella greenwoodii]
MVAKSRKHARKVTLDAAVNNAIEKAVDARKVAAFTVGAAGVLAGAAFAFGATPAMAADAGAAAEPAKAPVTTDNKSGTKPDDKDEKKEQISTKKDSEQKNDAKNEQKDEQKNKIEANAEDSNKIKLTGENNKTDEKTSTDSATVANNTNAETNTHVSNITPVESTVETSTPAASSTPAETTASTVAQGEDRAGTENKPNVLDFSKNLPNIYGWATPSNTFDEKLEKQEIVYHLPKKDNKPVVRVVILPDSKDSINTDDPSAYEKIIEFDSEHVKDRRQSYSGIYELKTNESDGSVDLIMKQPFSDGGISSGQGYCANRSIFLYYDKTNSQHDQTSNNFRVATLVPPKTAGSIVLKYDERLSAEKVREVLHKAVNLPTEHKSGSSVADQLVAQSKSAGVGLRVDESTVNNTPDTVDAKIPQKMGDYDGDMFSEINKTNDSGDYSFGERKLKTYLVTDLGMKSPEIPLTVVRYSTRIEKPVVDTVDFSKLTEDQKTQIRKNLAKLNGVSTDKVKFDSNGTATIDFDGLSPQDDPKIPLSDLVLTRVAVGDVVVPTGEKAVFVANPLGYSSTELDRIKTAIYEANKNNEKLGLSAKDYKNQISLEYVKGDTVIGHENIGISNGQAENTITVKIKTDKAFADFKSDIKANKLTRLPNIRTDYIVSWEKDKSKIDGRDNDEGLSWSNDSHTTIIYRYDPTTAKEFDTTKILDLLKATPKNDESGLRTLTGGETLAYEGTGNNPRKSHMHYVLQNGEPTTELTLGNMNGAYWYGVQKVSNSDVDLGDAESEAGSYSWDTEAGPVKVAGKKGKIFKARLFVEPYAMSYYKDVYLEQGRHPGNTAKAINVIFVPQTNHKTKNLKDSIGEHKTENVDGKDVPTQSKYYNASADKKEAYDKALDEANKLYNSVKDKQEKDLTEEQKAQIDNATIKLNKAHEALDGDDTKKEELNKSIKANGKAAEGDTAATPGTVTTDKYKNVTDQAFQTADGQPDTKKNGEAKAAKDAYDKALEEAEKVNKDANATQKAVDEAKAKLDAAREKLNEFTTNKDELNNAIAQHGKVDTGRDAHGTQTLTKADPTYQNSTPAEQKAYDDAVAEADRVSKDPNASQKEVNEAIKKLKDAKDALDKNATDKAPLDAAVQKTLDNPNPNDATKHSVFYTNAKAKTNDPDAQQAVKNYDDALAEAKRVLGDENATKADVDKAKKALEDAEKVLYSETYQTKATDLAEAIADNFSGYLMPAYFNAFDEAQAKGKDSQAAKDFKAYNDAYHAAKDLLTEIRKPNSTVTQDQANKVKDKLVEARKAIDKYATDTSKISAALLHSLAITKSPAYLNASAGAAGSDEAKAKQAYDDALEKLKKAFNDEMPQDTVDGKPGSAAISTNNIPAKDGDTSSPDYLKNIQAHAKGQPLNRDVPKLLADLNKAVEDLNKFATKTDKLQESINKDTDTQKNPAYKNTKDPHKLGDNGQEDTSGYETVKQKAKDYDDALTEAKKLLTDPTATQAQVDEALKKLDEKRDALKAQDTNVEALKSSVDKHGKEKQGDADATEGTVTSDAYRNASDPHFLNTDGKPDTKKNDAAKKAKADYDKALAEAQELLSKHDDTNTPLDAKPTQKQIDEALTTLDAKRKALEDYATKTDDLKTEADLSKADTEGASVEGKFENTPEFKNADAKKKDDDSGKKVDNDEVDAYKKALKAARDLLAKKDATNLSERPTQKQIDDALETLKKAKQAITDGYKTDATALQDEATLGEDGGAFTNSPEYKNAEAKKGEGGSDNAKLKAYKDALAEVTTMLNKFGKDGKPKANATDIPTQAKVDAALKKLSDARKAVEDEYKTDAKPLEKEVGDKTQDGKLVTPPFEESIPYKNALYKKQSETGDAATTDTSATKKLQDYNDKFEAAKKIIDQVNNPDPNAKPENRPTQAQVDQALTDLQNAKKAIDDNFKTKADALKKEAKELKDDGQAKEDKYKFEKSTEYQNALAKKAADGTSDNADVAAYKDALKKANELLDLFGDDGNPKANIPAGKQIPTQKEVDEALQNLKEIKDKILADYKTSSTELQQEVDKSKDGNKDKRDDVFENTPAFKNATAKGDDASKQALEEYNEKLKAAKKLLEKFDRTTGKPKDGATDVPTQKELYAALDALQAAKKKITDGYKTDKTDLNTEAGDDFTKSPEYQNAQ